MTKEELERECEKVVKQLGYGGWRIEYKPGLGLLPSVNLTLWEAQQIVKELPKVEA